MSNVYLKKIEITDADTLLKWRNDKDVFRYLGGGYNPVTRNNQVEITRAMIKDNECGEAYRFIIMLEDEPIGFVGLYSINTKNLTCELGIYIGEKDKWGNGYAKKAYLLIEEFAKSKGLRKIKLFVVRENDSAIKMYKKLAFREVGYFEKERLIDNNYHDLIIMEKMI